MNELKIFDTELTILIPAIRQNRWEALYDSAVLACKQHKWQLLLVTPFDLPESLKDKTNIKVIKDAGQVSRCVQRGMLEVESALVFLTVDDCTFIEDSIDKAIEEYWEKCAYDDVLNVRYSENGDIQPPEYYRAWHHQSTRLAGIEQHWELAPQFLMCPQKFIDMGGFDCQFEYINEPVHDLMFRIQKMGGKVYQSSTHCCVATWYHTTTGDHAPIHNAQVGHDWPIFLDMYSKPNDRGVIPYDNWKNTPEVWKRRFTRGVPSSYDKLAEQEFYAV